ncbi:MAG: glucose-1-phosphate thymidylyltransferase [Pirellulaceae bacterium]|nr:MAG: glucose-1-phosphate thymidylyltransferase [Pirellulaceae bacterium]
MSILLVEDARTPQLAPITTGRAAFNITVASFSLLQLVQQLGAPVAAFVRTYLRDVLAHDFPDVRLMGRSADSANDEGPTLVINARLTPRAKNLDALRELWQDDTCRGVVRCDGQIAAVVRPGWTWSTLEAQSGDPLEELVGQESDLPELEVPLELMSWPHEVIAANMDAFDENIRLRLASDRYRQLNDGLFVATGVRLGDYVLTETAAGPIVLDEHVSIGPYTLLRGPLYIGPRSRVLEHAAIKDAVCTGHTTKIGGEVEASVIEAYTNKQHHGFLGHSYLGSWINLGAGTCNSDLKNTYGTVNMEYPGGKMATGMQFLGCAMGDYSKTAINTGIFTGKVIGVCSMMYGFVTSNVPSFVNYARLFGQLATLPPEVMVATQQRMFRRRNVEQRPCDIRLIHDMYRITQSERDRYGDELAL